MSHEKPAKLLLGVSRAVFVARRALSSRSPGAGHAPPARPVTPRRRNILFITTDQSSWTKRSGA